MTREQIEQLTGRELDAEVAQRVMGWKPVPALHWMPEFANDEPSHWLFISPKYGEQTLPMVCWEPHRYIKDAWRVVEEMERRSYSLQLYCESGVITGSEQPQWTAHFGHDCQEALDETTGYGPTAQVALSRAALLAVMGEEKA